MYKKYQQFASQKFKWVKKHARETIIIAVVICGVVGLSASQAATFSVSLQPEDGTRSSAANIGDDVTASGGKYILFGANVRTQCASGGTYLWSHLEVCGWPGPTNTGPDLSQCGGLLTANSGSLSRTINVSTNNTVISCQNISGCIRITGTGVTVKNSKITCNTGLVGTAANGKGSIYIEDGASATISNVEIDGNKGVHACVWHQGTSMTVTAINCYGADDGIFSWADTSYSQTTGDNFTIKDSYFHDFTNKTSNGHIDGYQTEGAGNGLIDHNTFYMTSDDSNLE